MGHARKEERLDIADVLDAIRSLPAVAERSPGVFYIGRTPFLHFHTKAGDRWADAKAGHGWGSQMSLAFGSGTRAKSVFLREVRARYEACMETSKRSTDVRSNKLPERTRGEAARHGRGASRAGRSAARR